MPRGVGGIFNPDAGIQHGHCLNLVLLLCPPPPHCVRSKVDPPPDRVRLPWDCEAYPQATDRPGSAAAGCQDPSDRPQIPFVRAACALRQLTENPATRVRPRAHTREAGWTGGNATAVA